MTEQAQPRTNRPWDDAQEAELERLWGIHGGKKKLIARAMGRTQGSIDGKSRSMNLQYHGGVTRKLHGHERAAVVGATVHPSRALPAPPNGVLKPGDNQRKLGKRVMKGAWKGLPLYSLTLEERATCPRTCKQWLNCYGNNMGHAKRFHHGPELESAILTDLVFLSRRHPRGFVVRLHILGDFYSAAYVAFWKRALDSFPALRVFGYTAWQADTPTGAAVAALRDAQWDRFAVRTSGAADGPRTLVVTGRGTVQTETKLWAMEAIICPAQTGGTSHCGACALCWAPAAKHRPIAFLAH